MKNKSKYSNQQYKFISELLWGSVPVDRVWAEETNLFKSEANKILEKYPIFDKSFYEENKCIRFKQKSKFKTFLFMLICNIKNKL